jgi:hypothetical protein
MAQSFDPRFSAVSQGPPSMHTNTIPPPSIPMDPRLAGMQRSTTPPYPPPLDLRPLPGPPQVPHIQPNAPAEVEVKQEVVSSNESGKLRPMFCVVCASNNVRYLPVPVLGLMLIAFHLSESFDGGPQRPIVSRLHMLNFIITEAESFITLRKAQFRVTSSGTGSMVRLPGASMHEPNIYTFGTPYDVMYNDLKNKDERL